MAKDYFEDITPPDDAPMRRPASPPPPPAPAAEEKSIRNITVNRPRQAPPPPREMPSAPRSRPTWLLWVIAVVAGLAVVAVGLVALRKTTVTIMPRSQAITFDETSLFSAYPVSASTTGLLTYTVQTADYEDSEVLPTSGQKQADRQASGSIVVMNNTAAPVKLIKSTRFQTPEGLIFKIPADVTVPAKKGSAAGTIQVTIVADKPGANYNVGPIEKWTLPGLASNPDMYAKVYGRSSSAMTGGSSAADPAVDPTALANAEAQIRSRLEEKARGSVANLAPPQTALPELIQITYQDLPATPEPNNATRIHVKAHVSIPVFDESDLATAVIRWANADPQGAKLSLTRGTGFAASGDTASTLGASPITFTLKGAATVTWMVDDKAIAQALAGKDRGAFQTIANGFTSVQEAKARIEPFWSKQFPQNAESIYVTVLPPAKSGQ